MAKYVGGVLIGYTVISSSGYSIKQVSGRSMQPTFNPYLQDRKHKKISTKDDTVFKKIEKYFNNWQPLDWVLVKSKGRYDLQPGEIVTFYNPVVSTDRDIKRVHAVSHQMVSTRTYKNRTVIVPKGHIWVQGDNPKLSKDSNVYGPIPAALVFSKAVAIIFPPWRCQRLQSELFNSKTLKASERFEDDN